MNENESLTRTNTTSSTFDEVFFKDLEEKLEEGIEFLKNQLEDVQELKDNVRELPDSLLLTAFQVMKQDSSRWGQPNEISVEDIPSYDTVSHIVSDWQKNNGNVKPSLRDEKTVWDHRPELKKKFNRAERILQDLPLDKAIDLMNDLYNDDDGHPFFK